MNIKQAREQLELTVKAYLQKNAFGEYEIPVQKQRPVFLIGAPGIGKTAIVEQVSSALGIGLLSYSMTHHTRQSALGLPYIAEYEFEGKHYKVSEYTMSEMIADIYQMMKNSGIKEGILFLDEINCVSETLAPAMLQFLQYKTFGQHRLPEGWVVVTAGNPPEYNRSVREFDVAMLDRLKVMTVQPDFGVWKGYAASSNVHGAILSFLDARKEYFYVVETKVGSKQIVTPRAWEDLSTMICLCEKMGEPVNEILMAQYLQNEKIAREFSVHYELYTHYREAYRIEEILSGTWDQALLKKAADARLDERIGLTRLLTDSVFGEIRPCMEDERVIQEMIPVLNRIRAEKGGGVAAMQQEIDARKARLYGQEHTGQLQSGEKHLQLRVIDAMETCLRECGDAEYFFTSVKERFDRRVAALKEQTDTVSLKLKNALEFLETAFGRKNELLMMIVALTDNPDSVQFISEFGCEAYDHYSSEMLFSADRQELLLAAERIDEGKL